MMNEMMLDNPASQNQLIGNETNLTEMANTLISKLVVLSDSEFLQLEPFFK